MSRFIREIQPDGTVAIRRAEVDMSYVGRGEMPESTKELMVQLYGEAEDGNPDSGTTDPADGSGGTDRGQSGGSGI